MTTLYVKLNEKSNKFSIATKADATQSITIEGGKMQSPLKMEQFTVDLKKQIVKIIKEQSTKPKKEQKPKEVKPSGKVVLSADTVDFIASVDKDTDTINRTKEKRDATSVKIIHIFKDEMQKVESVGDFELNSKVRASVVAHQMSEKAETNYTKGVIAAIKYHYTEGHKIPNEFLTVSVIKLIKYARTYELISRNAATKPAADYKGFIESTRAAVAKHRAAEMAKKAKAA